jgi:hypothetical protein
MLHLPSGVQKVTRHLFNKGGFEHVYQKDTHTNKHKHKQTTSWSVLEYNTAQTETLEVCWVITVTCFSRLGLRTTSGIQESHGIAQGSTTQSSWLELCPLSINPLAPELKFSTQCCLTRFFYWLFCFLNLHFINICGKTNKYTNYSFSLLITYSRSYMFRHYIAIFRERS